MILHRLERHYQTALVRRRRGGIALTPAGEALYAYALEVTQAEERLDTKLAQVRERGHGLVRISATRTIAPHFLLPILPQFKEAFPDVQVTVETATVEASARRVLDGDADFGYLRRYEHPELINDLVRREPILFVAAPSNPLTCRSLVTVNEILEQPFVVLNQSSGLRLRLEQRLDCVHRAPLRVAVEVVHVEALKDAITFGLGCGWIYASLVERELRDGRLREIPVEGLTPTTDFCLVRRTTPLLEPTAAALYSFIRRAEAAQAPAA